MYPKIRFKEYTSDWYDVKVNEVLKKVKNPVKVISDKLYREIGIRSHGKGIFYKEPIIGEDLGNKSVFWVEPDALVLNIVFAWERAVARTTENEVGMIASHRFPMYKAVEELLDIDFITRFFVTPKGKYLLGLASPGGAGRNKTLGQKEFEELQLSIPSVEEQRKIGSFFSLLDQRIEKQQQKVEQLEIFKKSILQKIFSREIRFKDENGQDFPEWEQPLIGDFLKIRHGKSQKQIEDPKGKFPILATGGEIGRTNTPLYSKPSVLIGRKGTINKPQYMDTPFWTVDTLFFSEISERVNPKFVYYLFNQINWLMYNEASGVPSLSAATIESIVCEVPSSIEEQLKIANFLTVLDKKIEKEQNKLNYFKSSLLYYLKNMFV